MPTNKQSAASCPVAPAFDRAADLILDALEDAFDIVAPDGREICKAKLLNILNYYCLPK